MDFPWDGFFMDFLGKGLDDGKDQDRSGRDKFGKTERQE